MTSISKTQSNLSLSTQWTPNPSAVPATPPSSLPNLHHTIPHKDDLNLAADALNGTMTRNELAMPGIDRFILGPISIGLACAEFIDGVYHQDKVKQIRAVEKFGAALASFIFTIERYALLLTSLSLSVMYTLTPLMYITGALLCILEGAYQSICLGYQATFHKTLTFRSFYSLDTSGAHDIGTLRKKITELELLIKTHSKEFKKIFSPDLLGRLDTAVSTLKKLSNQQNNPLIQASIQYVDLAYKIKKEVVSRDLSYLLKEHVYPRLPQNSEGTQETNEEIVARHKNECDAAKTAYEAAKAARAALGTKPNEKEFTTATALIRSTVKAYIKAEKALKSIERTNAKALGYLAARVEPWLAIEIAHRCSTIDVTKNPSTPGFSTYHIDKNGNLLHHEGIKKKWTRLDDPIRIEANGQLLEQTDKSLKDVLGRPVIQANGELEESAKGRYAKTTADKIVKLSLVERLKPSSDKATTILAVDEAAELMSQVFIKSKQKILIQSLALTCIALTVISLLIATFVFPPAAIIIMSVASSVIGFARALISQGMLQQRNWTFQLGKGGYFAHWICDVIGAIGQYVLRIDKNGTLAQQKIDLSNAAALKC